MPATPGRRELNKQRTRRHIRRAALGLFGQDGFDNVTTVQVAHAADVSPATVFDYFATKEDLFFGQVDELEVELTELVAGVNGDESILTVLQGHVLYEITAGRAYTDPPAVTSFHAMVAASPSLLAREAEIYERRAKVLTTALIDAGQTPVVAGVAARQYIAAEQLVAAELRRKVAHADRPRPVLRELEKLVEQIFALARTGVGDLYPHRPA